MLQETCAAASGSPELFLLGLHASLHSRSLSFHACNVSLELSTDGLHSAL